MNDCYILYSPFLDRFYTGITHERVEDRLIKHNNKIYRGASTAITNDWEIYLIISCSSLGQAMKIENHIKRMKSRVFIQNLKRFPDLVEKILSKYK